MITSTQAQQYLDSALGVSVPVFLLEAAVARVAAAEQAMVDAGYDSHTQILIQCMAVSLVAAAGDPRRLSSQGAPSGASRGFKYKDGDLTALRRSLAALDKAGTVADIVGPDPAASAFMFVVNG
ncbi:DUF7370 family protein [Comamonas testosteroni]|uniref:DUF7370 family protein n=1 Tax=Comamonas testosteroni TaxID=285 RepID=UPI0006811663|nr:hypothetical protein [Comamonas testosteroni]